MWQYFSEIYFYSDYYSELSYVISKIQTFIFFISTIIFYNIFGSKISYPKNKLTLKKLKNSENNFLLLILFASFISAFLLISRILNIGFNEYMANRISLTRGLGLYSLVMYTSCISLCIYYISYVYKKKISYKNLLFLIITILICLSFILIGSRISIILVLFPILIANLIISAKFNFRRVLIWVPILAIIFSILSFVGQFRNKIDRFDAQDFTLGENIGKEIVVNFGKFENLLWLNDNSNKWDYSYGKTFLAGFTNFIPRIIWKSKPLGAGPLFKNYIVPFSYSIKGEYLSSYTTGLITESIMNFSWFGLFIIPFFLSRVLNYLKLYIIKIHKSNNIYQLSIYIYILFSVCFFFQFGEFLGTFTRTLFVILPFAIFNRINR